MRWTTLSAVAVTGSQLLQMWIATRIVSPAELGLFYITMLVLGFLKIFADGGFTFAVFHRQTMTAVELSSVYWMTVLVGVLIYAGAAAIAAPLVALAYGEPRLHALIALSSLSFVMVPFGLLHSTLLRKDLRFDLAAKIEVAAAVTGLVAMAAAALAGLRLFSLVVGILTNNLVRTALFVTVGTRGWRPEFRLDFGAAAFFVRFGTFQLGERVISYLAARSDQILISAFLGPEILGFYSLAWNFVVDPIYRINPIITRVFGPVLAKLQDEPARLKRAFLTLIEIVATINLPLVAGMAAVAPLLVPVMFGNKWLPIVPIMQILAVVGCCKAVGNPTGGLILAKGRADLAFRWSAIAALCQMPVLLLAVQAGSILVVAATIAVLQVFTLAGLYRLLYRPLIGACLGDWLEKILVPLGFALVMAAVVVLAGRLLHLTGAAGTALSIALGAAVYLALYALFRRDMVVSLATLTFSRGSG